MIEAADQGGKGIRAREKIGSQENIVFAGLGEGESVAGNLGPFDDSLGSKKRLGKMKEVSEYLDRKKRPRAGPMWEHPTATIEKKKNFGGERGNQTIKQREQCQSGNPQG